MAIAACTYKYISNLNRTDGGGTGAVRLFCLCGNTQQEPRWCRGFETIEGHVWPACSTMSNLSDLAAGGRVTMRLALLLSAFDCLIPS